MKESIGNALLFNFIITFIIILMAFFIGSIGYSKAYKVKNRIVEEIERNQTWNEKVQTEVDKWLDGGGTNGEGIGYRRNTNPGHNNLSNCTEESSEALQNGSSNYEYCVYLIDTCKKGNSSRCGTYYKVTAYMYFDVPIVGDFLKIPIHGETTTFNEISS